MLEVTLSRLTDTGTATLGRLTWPGQPAPIFTLEEPWRNNAPRISCIPNGRYKCVPWGWGKNSTVKFKRTWLLENVPGRTAILIHAGNTTADTMGCILVGSTVAKGEQARLIDSGHALDLLRSSIGRQDFWLTVQAAPLVKAA